MPTPAPRPTSDGFLYWYLWQNAYTLNADAYFCSQCCNWQLRVSHPDQCQAVPR